VETTPLRIDDGAQQLAHTVVERFVTRLEQSELADPDVIVDAWYRIEPDRFPHLAVAVRVTEWPPGLQRLFVAAAAEIEGSVARDGFDLLIDPRVYECTRAPDHLLKGNGWIRVDEHATT